MGKHSKDPAAEGRAFDKRFADSQARAAKKEKPAALPPKPENKSIGIPQNGPSTGEPSE